MSESQDEFNLTSADEPAEKFTSLEHTIRGTVKRIVYTSTDNSYTVLRLEDDNKQDQTLVGTLPGILEGQDIEASGHWEVHKEHGRQFRVASYQAVLPSSEEGIRKYLASGVLPGIGAVYAARIVKKFGTDTLRILDKESARLKEIPGIGKKKILEIQNAWKQNNDERSSRVFLQGLGLSPIFCTKIIAKYGNGAAPEIIRRNPYRLADDIDGIGFLSADTIAMHLGLTKDSPLRLTAGICHVLNSLSGLGHTCCPKEYLIQTAIKLLDTDEPHILTGIQTALEENKLIKEETTNKYNEPETLYFTRKNWNAENHLASSIRLLLGAPIQAVPPLQPDLTQTLNPEQWQAVQAAFQYGLSIVTGGPGVGKTTVVRQIAKTASSFKLKIQLAAPTGRAAKRLSEATRRDAVTIHRLLKWDAQTKAFVFNADNPLPCQMLVIDEVSMLDTALADALFDAIQPGTRVVLVGDRDQLPSVGPGAVLHDLIASKLIPVTFLVRVYRQADGSRIITNAHAVNNGQRPDLSPRPAGVKTDFYWVDQDDSIKAADLLSRIVAERIPAVFGFSPIADVQILSPMRKGDCGTTALNERLQNLLNPPADTKASFQYGSRLFRVGDKVMQTSNNYDKGVFNGEMGTITAISTEENIFQVLYDIGTVSYLLTEADQVQLAYAVTVHKSQGSEFPVVILPVLTQHFVMLQKNLIYTAMTRAKKLLILIGSRRALDIAIQNKTPSERNTRLTQRLLAKR